MNRKICLVFTIIICLLILSIYGYCQKTPEFVIKYPHAHARTHPQGIGADLFAQRVEELSNGRIKVEVFPAGEMGDEMVTTDSVMMGTAQMGSQTCSELSPLAPEYDIFNLPFLFKSYSHLEKVLAEGSELRDILVKSLEKNGLKVFGFTSSGLRNLYTKEPIKSIEDLKGKKIRVAQFEGALAAFEALGAKTVPITFSEVYLAIQTGVVDGCETSLTGWLGAKLNEVAPHVTVLNYLDSGRAYFMNQKFFNSLPADLQEVVLTAADEHLKATHQAYENGHDAVIQQVLKLDSTVTYLPLDPIIKMMQPVYEKINPTLGKEWIEKIQSAE